MRSWVEANSNIIGFVGTLLSFVGLIVSVFIWKSTGKINERFEYIKSQNNVVAKLKGHRDSLMIDGVNNMRIRSAIREELYSILKSYRSMFTVTERYRIRNAIRLINKHHTIDADSASREQNLEKICEQLDFVIARFQKKENVI